MQQKSCYTAFQAGNILSGHIGLFRYMFLCHVPVEAALLDPQANLHIERIFFLFSRMGSSMTILKGLREVRNKAVIVKGKCCSFI